MYVCYVLFLHGNSYFIDRLMGLYVISFTMIIQPAFYLNGDYKFRRNWDKKGPISAIKSAVWDCEWGFLWTQNILELRYKRKTAYLLPYSKCQDGHKIRATPRRPACVIKGQIISECPYEIIVSPKNTNEKNSEISALASKEWSNQKLY